jgi:hypothetical protein
MDVILELLDHAMGVVERVPERLRFELPMTRGRLSWGSRRRMFWSDGIPFINAVIRRGVFGLSRLV